MLRESLWTSAETAAARLGGSAGAERFLPFSIPHRIWEWLPENAASAEWRSLVFLNWPIAPERLTPFLPRGTELDLWAGKAWISVVGLTFAHTKVGRVPVPFQQEYPQVNLRFYVKHRTGRGVRRGVVFLKELVPRCLTSLAARFLLNENYFCRSMRGDVHRDGKRLDIEYDWETRDLWGHLHAAGRADLEPLEPGSHEEFLAHRLWSYTTQRSGKTAELHVEHPRWRACVAPDARLSLSDPQAFGGPLHDVLTLPPVSAFLCDGSPVTMARVRLL